MNKLEIRNRLLKAKDLRKVLKNLEKQGCKVITDEWYNRPSNAKENWTTVITDEFKIQFNWSVGKDEYDDKATHIWGISY